MFGWKLAINLHSIQDSLVNSQGGWFFLPDPANGLQHSFQHLQQRAWQDKLNGLIAKQRWVRSWVAKYLQRITAFKLLLQLCVYFTSGMPA